MMKKTIVLSIIITLFLVTVTQQKAETKIISDNDSPVISQGKKNSDNKTREENFTILELKDNAFLQSNGHGILRIEEYILNTTATPIEKNTWCFYWGSSDIYHNIFAQDDDGNLTIDIYEDFDLLNGSGKCIDISFRSTIKPGETYRYRLGIEISKHHKVENDTMYADWRLESDNSIKTYFHNIYWPYNQDGVTADPAPDYLYKDHAEWIRNDSEAPWVFPVNIEIHLGDSMAVPPLSQGIYPFDGQDIPWEDDHYGVYTPTYYTIGSKGCYLTSATMAMRYFATQLGIPNLLYPSPVNEWLQINNEHGVPRGYGCEDYNEDNDCIWYSLVDPNVLDDASRELFDINNPIIIIRQDDIEAINNNISLMRDNLQNGQLGILNVPRGNGHFVLVTGYTEVDGEETVWINDPFEEVGTTTLYEEYDNQCNGIRWFTIGSSIVRPNFLEFRANCPVELLITDSEGRRTGYDPRSGIAYDEIPYSEYVTQYEVTDQYGVDDGTKIIQIESMSNSDYQLEVIGTDTGTYSIGYISDLSNGKGNNGTWFGEIKEDEVDVYDFIFNPDIGILTSEIFLPVIRK